MRPSVRTRLTAVHSGLFLVVGGVLVLINYVLFTATLALPEQFVTVAAPSTMGSRPSTSPSPVLETARLEVAEESRPRDVLDALEAFRSSAIRTSLAQSLVALVIAVGIALVLGWIVAGRVLKPLQAITSAAHRLEATGLDRRIALDGPDDELKELADTFDGMLDRLAGAFDSRQRFVANASHELRTPLAIQRTLIEVAMVTRPEVRDLGRRLLAANERSERLIEGLLLLAQSDQGPAARTRVRLDAVVAEEVAACGPLAAEHDVRVTTELSPVAVLGDRVLLAHLVSNLVRNAVLHNVRGGSVRVSLRDSLVVVNTGEVIADDQVPVLFEPFRRLRAARTAGAKGSGLGLSIVRSIATAHHGEVTARPNPGGGLRVELILPA
ncbi:MAG: ATP-binding protein [Umezawaea sp.]